MSLAARSSGSTRVDSKAVAAETGLEHRPAASASTWQVAIILIVPMCLLAAMAGVILPGQDNNVLTQIGLVVLIALAAKSAIFMAEFAKQAEERDGASPAEAAVIAAKERLRPILMTSFAFVLGVLSLRLASGAGAELRQALGTAVFTGMLGVTAFGPLFTPTFYVVCRALSERVSKRSSRHNEALRQAWPTRKRDMRYAANSPVDGQSVGY